MSRKRLIKLLMSIGFPRNDAVCLANACNGQFSHGEMAVCAVLAPELRDVIRASRAMLAQGVSLKMSWTPPN